MKQFLILLTLCFVSMNTQAQTTIGLVAHYPFSGDATDAVGTVDGTASNATLTTDRFGTANSAYSFTSSGSRSSIGLGDNFNSILSGSGSDFSVSIWFKRANASQKMTLFSKHANSVYCGSSNEQMAVLLNADGTIQLNYYNNSGTVAANYDATTLKITDTLWHHLVVTYDGGIATGQDRTEIYVDNTLWPSALSNNGTNVAVISGNTAHAAIGHVLTTTGGLCANNTYGSDGVIDDVRLYSRTLLVCDVDGLFYEGNPLDGPIAYYPFSGDATDAIGSVDGTANNATLTTDRFGIANRAYSFTSAGANRSFIGLGDNFNGTVSGSGSKFSISIWVKRANTSQKMTLFSKHSNSVYCSSSNEQVALLLNANGSLQLNYYNNTGSVAANYDITTLKITNAFWNHIVVTYDGSIATGQDRTNFYVNNNAWASAVSNNGTDVAAISGNLAHAAIGHVITTSGTLCSATNYGSDGSIDDVGLYDRVLTPCDVASLYTPNLTLPPSTRKTSVFDIKDSGVSLMMYPNPVEDVLNLEIESTTSIDQELNVQIVNITGQVLQSQVLQSNTMSISTSQLATGIYFVRVLDGTKTIAIQKMIKY